jgi:hypothetical protein
MQEDLDGVPFLVMDQAAEVSFDEIATTRERASEMPLWTEKVAYDRSEGVFSGIGACAGYTVTKTF